MPPVSRRKLRVLRLQALGAALASALRQRGAKTVARLAEPTFLDPLDMAEEPEHGLGRQPRRQLCPSSAELFFELDRRVDELTGRKAVSRKGKGADLIARAQAQDTAKVGSQLPMSLGDLGSQFLLSAPDPILDLLDALGCGVLVLLFLEDDLLLPSAEGGAALVDQPVNLLHALP